MTWEWHTALMAEMKNAHKILVGKPEGRRQLGAGTCRCKDNIQVDIKESGYENVNLVHMHQDMDQWQDLGWLNECYVLWESVPLVTRLLMQHRK
jgi:hypothetical protein